MIERDDLIRMARDAGLPFCGRAGVIPLWETELQRFAELVAAMTHAQGDPVAWMHTLDNTEGIPENEPWKLITSTPNNPFGQLGVDYSESYPWSCEPLYTARPTIPDGYVMVPKEPPDNWTQAALHLRCPRCGNKQDIKFERGIVASTTKP